MIVLLVACRDEDVPPGPRRGDPAPDPYAHVVEDCEPASGRICPFAGAGYNGWNGDEPARFEAWFSFPSDVVVPVADGVPLVFDTNNGRVREVGPDTLATAFEVDGPRMGAFTPDGRLVFTSDQGLGAWDPTAGALDRLRRGEWLGAIAVDAVAAYVVDTNDEQIVRFDLATGTAAPFASIAATRGGDGGGLALADELLFVAESALHVISAIELGTGERTVLSGAEGEPGYVDGPAADARWSFPTDLAYEPETDLLFVADTDNHVIRAIDLASGSVATVAGTGVPTCPGAVSLAPANCDGQHTGGDGGLALEATLYRPHGIALDGKGDLLVADTYDHRIRGVYR